MHSLLAIREPKRLTSAGTWNSGKKMPKTAFPLSKSHSYALGRSYDWVVSECESDGRSYRVLVAFDPAKARYRAWLGLVCGSDQALIARLEYHPTHRGWHCHVKTGSLEKVARGVVKESRGHERFWICGSSGQFNVSQFDAQGVAFRAFNISVPPSGAGGLFS